MLLSRHLRERAQPCVLGRLLPVLLLRRVAIRGLGARRASPRAPRDTLSESHAPDGPLASIEGRGENHLVGQHFSNLCKTAADDDVHCVTQSPLYKGLHDKFCFVFGSRRNSVSADKLACFLLSENENYGTPGAPLSAPWLDKTELDLLPACCNLLSCGVQRHLLLLLPLNGLIFYVQMSHYTSVRCVSLRVIWGSVDSGLFIACASCCGDRDEFDCT